MLPTRLLTILASLPLSFAPASAQCTPHWGMAFSEEPGVGMDLPVNCLQSYDEGSGPVLFAGGSFSKITGRISASCIARWDGSTWSPLGQGVSDEVRALCCYDEAGVTRLFVGGAFLQAGGLPASRIARWDGSGFTTLGAGTNGSVSALTVFDDGSGPRLYAGGSFTLAGGVSCNNIAAWNGTSWAPLLDGLANGLGGAVDALAVYDGGSGPRLYAAGSFGLRRWDGLHWTTLYVSGGQVYAMCPFDDGTGPSLVFGGGFTAIGSIAASRIARLQGTTWLPFGTGLAGTTPSVRGVCAFDDGSGPALYAAGSFSNVGGAAARHVARWKNGAWSGLGSGLDFESRSLGTYGNALYIGGFFGVADGTVPTQRIARWNGSTFSTVGAGNPAAGLNGLVVDSLVFDDGSGPALIAAGDMTIAGQAVVGGIARWNGSVWSSIGMSGAVRPVFVGAVAVYDAGSGAELYGGGHFRNVAGAIVGHVARFDGTDWHVLNSATDIPAVRCLLAWDDGAGPALYVGGQFSALNGVPAKCIARWDGSTWTALGPGLDMQVNALAVFDAGAGPRLTAGGYFTSSGGSPVANVAQWDGSTWTQLGSGAPPAEVLFAADLGLGAGAQLFACGIFGVPTVFGGGNWSALGSFPGSSVFSFALFDDGSGARLVAGGNDSIASWNGSSWSMLGSGVTGGIVHALTVYDGLPGFGPDLYAGGSFSSAGGASTTKLAVWEGCLASVSVFCEGDGTLAPCPCANSGAAGHGCDNSIGTGGSLLGAHGTVSPDTMVLSASAELPTALSIFLQGNAEIAPIGFGDGLRCAGGGLRRLYARNAAGGTVAAPTAGDASISARSAALGDAIAPGTSRAYQVYYRDANASFCPAPAGNTWNVSNAVRITW